MYYLYLIESEMSGRYYIGQTTDLTRQSNEHNGKKKKYTETIGPWRLIGHRSFKSRSDAVME